LTTNGECPRIGGPACGMITKTSSVLKRRMKKQLVSSETGTNPLTIKSILVPLDFSPASFKALDFAVPLSECFGARVHLVHAFDFDYPSSVLEAMPIILPEATLVRNAKCRLTAIAKEFPIAAQNLHVVQGRAYRTICELARKLGTDLIVTAACGRSALEHVSLGSTAQRIVQHAPCPVLVVRGRQRNLSQGNGHKSSGRASDLKKILVPLDFSDCSMAGLGFAVRFAQASSTRLVLLNNVPVLTFAPYAEYAGRCLSEANHHGKVAAEKEMSQLSSTLRARGIDAETAVARGVPAHQICLHAKNHDLDLIVISRHGSSGLMPCLLGSTAEHIVRHAPCPVLVVPNLHREKQETGPKSNRGAGSLGPVFSRRESAPLEGIRLAKFAPRPY